MVALKLRIDAKELGVVQGLDLIEGDLAKRGLKYVARVPPNQMGFDEENRGKLGANFNEVHLLANDIVDVGFS